MSIARFVATIVPVIAGVASGQTSPPPPAYTYDVVSIHKSDPAARNVHIGADAPQGGLRTTNTSVLTLIAAAFHTQDYQIVGAPAWAAADRFDVLFTPDKKELIPDYVIAQKDYQPYLDRNLQRLQAVLRDRFRLVLHTETRELPIYSLVQTKGGNKLRATDGTKGPSISTNNGRQIRGVAASMDMLAEQLSMELVRPVHNDTGIQGQFDFMFSWTPDPPPGAAPASNSAVGPSIFTVISDPLGLRLESSKGPVQVYVIDKITPPTDN